MRSEKKKMSLKEAILKYKINYSVLEEHSGLPNGVIAQHIHGRAITMARLKVLTKGLASLGKEVKNIQLIQDENKSNI